MKKFNLDEYLANPSIKVVARNGKSVRIVCTDFDNELYPIIGEIQGEKYPEIFTKKGEYLSDSESGLDLFFAAIKHEGWVNIYRNLMRGEFCEIIHTSKEEAKRVASPDVIATIKIEWEE